MFFKFKNYLYFFVFLTIMFSNFGYSKVIKNTKENELLKVLGLFPKAPSLEIKVLEKAELINGLRYKIEYSVENEDFKFNRPVDKVKAYLFVPNHEKGTKLPAVVAIHQDGNRYDLGKLEPAGLDGSTDQFYGLELFNRGYVVICSDRYAHGERRRLDGVSPQIPKMMQNLSLWMKWTGQLILNGRTYIGKEVYDLVRAVDVLETYDFVDKNRVGAIGHSAGGNILVYFMFFDKRIKVGVSSCGFFDLINYYNEDEKGFVNSIFALPNLASVGSSSDYLSCIAPSALLITRGLYENGKETPIQKNLSDAHVQKTKNIEKYVRKNYISLAKSQYFQAIYFQGGHEFPKTIRQKSYEFLDKFLKK